MNIEQCWWTEESRGNIGFKLRNHISTEVYSLSGYAYFTIFLYVDRLMVQPYSLSLLLPQVDNISLLSITRLCNDSQHTSADKPAQSSTSSLLLVRLLQATKTHLVALFYEFPSVSAAQTYRFTDTHHLIWLSNMPLQQHISFAF
jgi:hypothetical protein